MDYFVVKYSGGESGCPHHLSGEMNQEEWEWDPFSPNPHQARIEKQYAFKVTDPDIETIHFDFYEAPSCYVSDKFLSLCDVLNVSYRAVPLEIQISNGGKIQSFPRHIFLIASGVSLLDKENSEFSLEMDLETGMTMYNRYFPDSPIYSFIGKFVSNTESHPALFRCIETMELVCNSEFKDLATSSMLHGISFLPIDEQYKFDPWGEHG